MYNASLVLSETPPGVSIKSYSTGYIKSEKPETPLEALQKKRKSHNGNCVA